MPPGKIAAASIDPSLLDAIEYHLVEVGADVSDQVMPPMMMMMIMMIMI